MYLITLLTHRYYNKAKKCNDVIDCMIYERRGGKRDVETFQPPEIGSVVLTPDFGSVNQRQVGSFSKKKKTNLDVKGNRPIKFFQEKLIKWDMKASSRKAKFYASSLVKKQSDLKMNR